MTLRVLISGSSIAGPTLAYWLTYHGFRVTLVERAPAPRPGGQAIDVRGAALGVLEGMGLLDAARGLRTQMKGVSILDAEGKEVWRSDKMTFTGGRFANDDIEILRDDLSRILLSKLSDSVELIYGDTVTGLTQEEEGVSVSFERGSRRRFDLVVGADGLHSNVRDLVFGEESGFLKQFGIALAVYSAPNHLGVKDWQIAYRDQESNCLIYTARNNTELRVGFGFNASAADEHVGDLAAQKRLLRERFAHLRWEVPKLLDAVWSAPDFWLGLIAQVHMTRWTEGRVALVGDAGYCPSPFSGQGTSLALVGAYVLAYELAASRGNHTAAFARYESKMRPYVEMNQTVADIARDEQIISASIEQSQTLKALDKAKNCITLEGLPKVNEDGCHQH